MRKTGKLLLCIHLVKGFQTYLWKYTKKRKFISILGIMKFRGQQTRGAATAGALTKQGNTKAGVSEELQEHLNMRLASEGVIDSARLY